MQSAAGPDLIEARKRTVDWRGIAEIRLVSTEDGPGRGQRLILGRNAAGLAFEVAVDRGFDLSALSWKGINLGWHGPNRLPFPPASTTEDGGRGMLRATPAWRPGGDHGNPKAHQDRGRQPQARGSPLHRVRSRPEGVRHSRLDF